jgi:hypothetical protein
MIAVLKVMGDMDISHDLLGLVGLGLLGLSLVGLVWFVICSRCKACVHGSWFGYRWMLVSVGRFLATGVTPVSLWLLITMGNLGVSSCLDVV